MFSCKENDSFNAENIIPTPKKMAVNNPRLYHIKDVVVNESSSDNLIYPQNKDEYFLKTEIGNV